MSETQAAFNEQATVGGAPGVSPGPAILEPDLRLAFVGSQMIASANYLMTNEPASFPHSIPPNSSITFDVQTAISQASGEMWVTNTIGQSQTNILIVSNGEAADGTLTFRLTSRSTGVLPLPIDDAPLTSRIRPGHNFSKLAPGLAYVPGELLVRFSADVNGPARTALLAAMGGGEVRREYKVVPGLALVKLPPGTKIEDTLPKLNDVAGVIYAEPNYRVQAFDTTPNDARFDELWGLHNTGQTGGTPDADIDAPAAWDFHTGSSNIIVCVIDTGIDYTHEDLAGSMWRPPGEIPGNLIDDDNNGFVDDVYGINAITGSGDPADDNDHGTHCSGTMSGIGNNGVGVAGVNWHVRLMAAKFLEASGFGDTAAAVTCVEYAVDKGARVLSNSWGGGGYSQAMKDAIDAAAATEISFIAAAGNANADNDAVPSYPSGYESDNVVSVMSTDHNDQKSGFSSYGQTTVDLAAPGSDILSCKRGGGYVSFSGTSMATPHVAGAAALLLAANVDATVEEIKQAMMNTVDVLFPTLCVSGGRLSLASALQEMKLPWLSFDPDVAINAGAGILAQRAYKATVLFSNTVNGLVQTRNVALTVQGDIAFASSTFMGSEIDGSAVITVLRGGHTNLAAAVNFSTSNETATAGNDYVATNGTLMFAAGQVSGSFTVILLDDAIGEGSESLSLRLSQPTGGATLGEPRLATLNLLDNDSVPTSLPKDVFDGGGYLWDILGNGSIDDGTSDAFDGGHYLYDFSSFGSGLLVQGGRELIIGPETSGNVATTRRIYVPADQAYARFMEVLHNVGPFPVTLNLFLETDLGSDGATVVVGTSSGDTTFSVSDKWIVTDDADGAGDPTVLHVIANDLGALRPNSIYYSSNIVGYEYQVDIPPGETRMVMHFGAQNPNRSIAMSKAPALAALGLGALTGISAQELAQIVNFGLPETHTSRGTPISWLQAYGLTNDDWEVEDTSDMDDDGMDAWEEFAADTDPTLRSSVLSLIDLSFSGSTMRLDWKGGHWATQYLEVSDSLMATDAFWRCIETNGVLPTLTTNFSVWTGVTNPARYYRIKAGR